MAGRSTVTAAVEIERSPDDVFTYLADVSRHQEWSPKAFRVEGVAPGPVKVGDTFTSTGVIPGDKNHSNDVTVVEVSAPTRLVLNSSEKSEHFINTFDLAPLGDGKTRLTRTLDLPQPGFPLSAALPLIKALFIKPDLAKGLNRLKSNLERPTT